MDLTRGLANTGTATDNTCGEEDNSCDNTAQPESSPNRSGEGVMAEMAGDGRRWCATEGVVGALNREWRRYIDEESHHHRGMVAIWRDRHPELHDCYSVADVVAAIQRNPDNSLAALLAEVRHGDEFAGRVILQSLIGRMVRMAQRDVRAGVDEYVAALWCAICTYPLARRPRHIAANLALDTLKAVQREGRWVVRGAVTTWPPGEYLDGLLEGREARSSTELPPLSELLETARGLAVIDDAACVALTSVYLDGLSSGQAALRHDTSAGSIRLRCSRAVERLRSSSELLLAAA